MIRRAKIDDFNALLPIFEQAHEKTFMRNKEVDQLHMKRVFATLSTMPSMFCYVSEKEGVIEGCLGGGIDKNASGVKIAMDIIFVSNGNTDKLLKKFISWANSSGADFVHITSLVENSRYDKLLKTIGLNKAGHCFALEV